MQQAMANYVLLCPLNSQGARNVFLAKSADPVHKGRVLAIKRMRADLRDDPSFVALFVEQAKRSVQLIHRNIARTFELGSAGADYYTAMEYVSGVNLASVMHRALQLQSPLGEHVALLVVLQVCRGLAHAHGLSHPLLHEDVRPSNIMVSFAGEVKLINFGVAHAARLAARARISFFKRRLAYLAPEQLRGCNVDGRADLFGVGAVLYEMLTQEPLFDGHDDATVAAKLRAGTMVPARSRVPNLAYDVDVLLQRTLTLDPAGRFADANAMVQAVSDILERRFGGTANLPLADFVRTLFTSQMRREVTLLGNLVGGGWLSPQATSVLRWVGSGLPSLANPVIKVPPPLAPRPLFWRGPFLVTAAAVAAVWMVLWTWLATQ